MQIIKTDEIDYESLSGVDKDWIYNGLDVCITADVLESLLPQLDPTTTATYTFSKSLQGPVLEMRLRGCLIDTTRKVEVIDELFEQIEIYETQLEKIVREGLGFNGFNWRSNADLRKLFYDILGISPIRRGGSPTCDRAAREKLEVYPVATVLIRLINTLAELGDKISVLRTEIDPDGRIRTSYNIAGTSTGRFSSSLSEFGTGGNLQNVEESLRSIFIADPGFKFAKCDAKSGESFVVGAIEWNLFHDPRFLDACESGDVHTAVAKLVWPGLGWTGDRRHDKDLAETDYYRGYTHRFMCKKIGHGSNYLGGAPEIASQTRIDLDLVQTFQTQYFRAFPAHKLWHAHVDTELRRTGIITSLMNRKRHFFKRRTETKTLKEAIAYDPQSSLADIVNRALLNIWRLGIATIVFQDHDAITFMYPEDREDEVVPELQKHLIVPVELADGRVLRIPYDCETGWNKGKYDATKNPDGLKGFTGHDDRRRTPQVGLLDRIIHRSYRKRTHT